MTRSQSSSVSTVTRPRWGHEYFSSLWGSFSFVSNSYQGLFALGLKRPGHEAENRIRCRVKEFAVLKHRDNFTVETRSENRRTLDGGKMIGRINYFSLGFGLPHI
jgi:hypothetical protein